MQDDRVVQVSEEDEQMEAAVMAAKASFRQFIEAFAAPRPGQTMFLVKVVFDEGDAREHIWLADLDLSTAGPSGVVANEPNLPGLRFMQRVKFDPMYISDWMYVQDGVLVGGFTTRALRERMSPEERAALDAALPYRFE